MKTLINDFIKEIETQNLKNDAYFGFYEFGGANDDIYIKANKEGLRMYVFELLKTSIQNEKERYLNLDEWVDSNSDFIFNYIEITKEKRNGKKIRLPEYKETLKDKIFKLGCAFTFIILAVIFLIGLVTVLAWLF